MGHVSHFGLGYWVYTPVLPAEDHLLSTQFGRQAVAEFPIPRFTQSFK